MALLDETDIEILHSLQKDAKINAKELSEKLHISKTPIYERIKRLENEGYIKGYVALVDNKKIGLPLIIFCNVSLAVHDDEHIARFKEKIRNIDDIMDCYSTGGIYDFFVKMEKEHSGQKPPEQKKQDSRAVRRMKRSGDYN